MIFSSFNKKYYFRIIKTTFKKEWMVEFKEECLGKSRTNQKKHCQTKHKNFKIDEQLQWEELFGLGGTEDKLEVGKKSGRGGRITGKEKALAIILTIETFLFIFSFSNLLNLIIFTHNHNHIITYIDYINTFGVSCSQ